MLTNNKFTSWPGILEILVGLASSRCNNLTVSLLPGTFIPSCRLTDVVFSLFLHSTVLCVYTSSSKSPCEFGSRSSAVKTILADRKFCGTRKKKRSAKRIPLSFFRFRPLFAQIRHRCVRFSSHRVRVSYPYDVTHTHYYIYCFY